MDFWKCCNVLVDYLQQHRFSAAPSRWNIKKVVPGKSVTNPNDTLEDKLQPTVDGNSDD